MNGRNRAEPRPVRTRRQSVRRVGLVLATALVLGGLPPSLDISPTDTGTVSPSLVVLVFSVGFAVADLVLLVPAWRGQHAAAVGIALLQFLGIIPALPAFFIPPGVVPGPTAYLAGLGILLGMGAVILIVLDTSAALLYAAAVTIAVTLYGALVAVAGSVLPDYLGRTVIIVVAIIAALTFRPLLSMMQQWVSHLVYGTRSDPAATALDLARNLPTGEDAVAAAVGATARALRLPGLELRRGRTSLARAGQAVDGAGTGIVDLAADCRFVVTLRPGERRLHRADRAALELAGVSLVRLLREVDLLADLRVARAEAAQTREAERSHLHRELHDGIAPVLTGAALRIDAASRLLPSDAPGREHLVVARTELRTGMAELRRLGNGLRPVELAQYGLWGAIERRAAALPAELRLPSVRPEVGPGTELATYRVVSEALTNVQRHAPGSPARVDIAADADVLSVRIRNRLPPEPGTPGAEPGAGTGVDSMRARVEELSGTAYIGRDGADWLVEVTLPLGDAGRGEASPAGGQ